MSHPASAPSPPNLPLVRIYHIFTGLVLLLLLGACQAPTALPDLTGVLPTRTAVSSPSPVPTAQASPIRPHPVATPSLAPTLSGALPPADVAPGEQVPVHYLPAPVCCLASDPFDLRVVYALLADGHFYISPDRGQIWQRLPMPHPEAVALEAPAATVGQPKIFVSATRPGLIFVLSFGTLLRSPDRGQTWQEVARDVASWTTREQDDRLQLYAWREGRAPEDHGLFRSQDEGETWLPQYSGFFPPTLQTEGSNRALEGMLSLALDPSWEEHLYAGTNFGIFRSRDGGVSWEPFETGLPALDGSRRAPQLLAGAYSGMYALTEGPVAAGGGQFLLARLAHGQVIPGQDSWEPIGQADLAKVTGQDLPGFYGVYGLEKDPLDENVLFLATSGGLLASRDGGQAWRLLNPAAGRRPVYRVAAAPGVPTRLYLSTAEGFASQPFEWPGPHPDFPPVVRPQISPQVEFTVKDRIGGELTAYALDLGRGPDAGMAYVGIGSNLVLMDISQETVPDLWSSVPMEGELAKSVAVSSGRVYLLSGERTLREIDVSDRANPRLVSKITLPNLASFLAVHEQTQTLLVSEQACSPGGCQGGLRIYSLSTGLSELVFLPTLAPVERIEFVGDYAYAFEQGCREWVCTASLRVVDLAAEPLPRQVAILGLPGRVVGVEEQGDHLYVAHRRGLLALDISDRAHPNETNPLDLSSLSTQEINGMALSQGYAYLNGLFGIDIFSLEDPGRPRYVKTWQSESGYSMYDLLANQQALYAIETFGEFGHCDSHLVVLDLTDPENPRPVAPVQGSSEYACATQPTLVLERLYLVDWDGLHILDLADPLHPLSWADYTVTGLVEGLVADQLRLFWTNWRASESLYGMDVTEPESYSMAGPLPSTWSMGPALSWNYLFLPAWADGLIILDVFDYASPVTLKALSAEQLGGSPSQAVLAGRYLYVVQQEGGLRILQVAEPSRPRIIGSYDLVDSSIADLVIHGDYAYLLTAAWAEEARRGEIVVLDIRNPANPRRAGSLPLQEGEQLGSLAAGRGWLYAGGEACTSLTPDETSCTGRLVSYSLADPRRPERAGQFDLPAGVNDIALDGELGYLAAGAAGIWAIDLSSPARPILAGQQDIPSGAQALAVVYNRVYVAAGQGGLVVLDVAEK